jgi:hypothetical protein
MIFGINCNNKWTGNFLTGLTLSMLLLVGFHISFHYYIYKLNIYNSDENFLKAIKIKVKCSIQYHIYNMYVLCVSCIIIYVYKLYIIFDIPRFLLNVLLPKF